MGIARSFEGPRAPGSGAKEGCETVVSFINEFRFSVLLSEEELAALGIGFAQMRLENPAFRAALWLLRGKLREEGACPDLGGRLLVEACREADGARLFFTSLSGAPGRALVRRENENAVLKSASPEALRRAAALLGEASLWETADGFYLLAQNASPAKLAAASEFAEPVPDPDGVLWARVREHGKEVKNGRIENRNEK